MSDRTSRYDRDATYAEVRSARRERARNARRKQSGLSGAVESVGDAVSRIERPVTVIAICAVIFVIAMLYGPTRGYYVAVRTGQTQQAIYEAYAAQNELLRQDLERLQSKEGIEDEAHRRGLVGEDETSVVVDGVPPEDTSAMLGDIVIEDTRPWYIKVLDIIFFYDPNNWQ